jgi:glucose/arabinose dehydrogenase
MKKLLLTILAFTCYTGIAQAKISAEKLTEKLERPWAVNVLDDGRILVTERAGFLRVWKSGQLSAPIKLADNIFNEGQGGLLDVIAHPDFKTNKTVYFTYSTGDKGRNATRLASAQLHGNELVNYKILFTAQPYKEAAYHFAGRMAFLPDGTLVFGVGDGYKYMKQAQTLDNHFGKIIRLNDDGSVPADNPFVNTPNAKPEIYSYGHRNPQGLVYDSKSGSLLSNEHGPKGGDEINLIQAGLNYGWPEITYGIDYSGDIISELTHKEGMEQPLLQWNPSIAPSSLIVYRHEQMPELQNSIINSALKYQEMRQVKIDVKSADWKLGEQTTWFKNEFGRMRDITMDAAGNIFVVTDGGILLKVSATE